MKNMCYAFASVEAIDSVPQVKEVACHHSNAQTNKPTKRDDRVSPLSRHYIMLIRPQQALLLARIY